MTKRKTNSHLLNVSKVADIFQVEETTVRDWARKGVISGQKVGKSWFFNQNYIFGMQGEKDAAEMFVDLVRSEDKKVDFLRQEIKIEVKSAKSSIKKTKANHWRFSNFREGADFYLLLCYDKNRKNLLSTYYVPYEVLRSYVRETPGSSFIVEENDSFFEKYNNWKGGETNGS